MTNKQLEIAKRAVDIYWLSIIVAYSLYFETTIGYYYVLGGLLIFIIHLIEIPFTNNIITKHSDEPMKDRLRMLAYGYIIPTMLLNKAKKN